ncbi:hypothetical protein [Streptomyces sp. NPDC046925]|uniref:hypothetical protein n=1 Tax=Streptomyces sp. NPDC046925 TaxID=3155375 RepID=UPI00340ACECD
MSWHGRYARGAMRSRRIAKREDAQQRNAATDPEQTKAHRLGPLDINQRRTARSIRRYLKERKKD